MNEKNSYKVTTTKQTTVYLRLDDSQMLKLLKRLAKLDRAPSEDEGNIVFYARYCSSPTNFIVSNTTVWSPPTIATHRREVKSPW